MSGERGGKLLPFLLERGDRRPQRGRFLEPESRHRDVVPIPQPGKFAVDLGQPGARARPSPVAHRAASPRIGAAAAIAQPQAHQMAAALGLGEILELGAGVPQHAIIDELHLSRFEVEFGRQVLILEQVEQRGERGGALVVDRLAPQRVAAADLVRAEAGLHLVGRR